MTSTMSIATVEFGSAFVEKLSKMGLSLIERHGEYRIFNPRKGFQLSSGWKRVGKYAEPDLAYGEQWELWNTYRSEYKFRFADQYPDFHPGFEASDEDGLQPSHCPVNEEYNRALACVWPREWSDSVHPMPVRLEQAQECGYDRILDAPLGSRMTSEQLLKDAQREANLHYIRRQDKETGKWYTAPRHSHVTAGVHEEDIAILREIFVDASEVQLEIYEDAYIAMQAEFAEAGDWTQYSKASQALAAIEAERWDRMHGTAMVAYTFSSEPERSEKEQDDVLSRIDWHTRRDEYTLSQERAAVAARKAQKPVRRQPLKKRDLRVYHEEVVDGRRRIRVA